MPTNYLDQNKGKWNNRILVSSPMVGVVRSEWIASRYGQIIPTNWSHVETMQWMSSHFPLQYQIADAENLTAKIVVEQNFEWLLFIEHDNILPPNTFVKLNQYMIRGDIPVVGALYFTKSSPPEPMIYRQGGYGYYADWKLGDKVWCSGLPFGCTLIHGSLIRELWKISPEYQIGNQTTRRVFNSPQDIFTEPSGLDWFNTSGTSDLEFFKTLKEKKILEKAGWPEYQKKEFPYLVDTGIFVKHIDMDGVQWPRAQDLPQEFYEGKVTLKSVL